MSVITTNTLRNQKMFEFRTAINKEIECRINYMINYEEYI